MKRSLPLLISALLLLGGCLSKTPTGSPMFPEQDWHSADWHGEDWQAGAYLLAPGDELEIMVHTAPELSRSVRISPDGQIRMPYSPPIAAAARTVEAVRRELIQAMASELRDPDLDILLTGTASQSIFVGGEVARPGMFDLPGLIDPLQAIIMAGGVTDEGRANTVILMRRLPGGEVKSAIFDIKSGLYDPHLAVWTPLRRFDIVYVTRKPIADQNLFVRQFIRNALPINFSIYYDIAGDNRQRFSEKPHTGPFPDTLSALSGGGLMRTRTQPHGGC